MTEYKVVKCPKCYKLQVSTQNLPKNAFKCRFCGRSTKMAKILFKTEKPLKARLFMYKYKR